MSNDNLLGIYAETTNYLASAGGNNELTNSKLW